jgi:hypothetical protein
VERSIPSSCQNKNTACLDRLVFDVDVALRMMSMQAALSSVEHYGCR